MRRLVWHMMMSLDGYMETPGGALDWHIVDDAMMREILAMLDTIDTIVFGRVTYDMMAAHWPTATSPEAPRMNALEKVIFSRTPRTLSWQNARQASRDLQTEVVSLKAQPGRDIAVFGSAALASELCRLGLVDVVRVIVHPLVLGRGGPMFKDFDAQLDLELLSAKRIGASLIELLYRPKNRRG